MRRPAMQREPRPARLALPFAPAWRPTLVILASAALLGCAADAAAQAPGRRQSRLRCARKACAGTA